MIRNVLSYLDTLGEPEAAALIDETRTVTYGALRREVAAIGTALGRQGFRNRPVAVVIGRDVESVILFLGVAASGNFYVPLDGEMARGRLETMLETLDPAAVVGRRDLLADFPCHDALCYEDLIVTEPDEALLRSIRDAATDLDPLYGLFTSGSTGVPKCVLVSHRSVIDLTEQFAETFPFDSWERFGNQAPFDFDVSVKDIYGALRQGAALVVIPRRLFAAPGTLVQFLNEHRVSTLIWAVSALHIVSRLKVFRKEQPRYLRNVLFSGEVMPIGTLNYWREALPGALFVNLYGPTEITCNCTYYMVDRPFTEEEVLPIGRPFPNTRIYLLKEDGREAGPGEVGEICVGGAGVALGYYHAPELTEKAFTQNPLNPDYPERIYRTGDLGRYNEQGELLFLSRRDDQIKHMGHRIELGEIEAAVNSLPFVRRCCCLYDGEKGRILGVYEAEAACDRELLRALGEKLPKYMWPNRLFWRESLPVTGRGKLDRAALRQEYLS